MSNLTLITAPTAQPLTLNQAKLQLRIDHDTENELIDDLISQATEYAQHIQERQLITATYEMALDGFPDCREIEFPLPPLQSVVAVTYLSGGVSASFPSENFTVDVRSTPGRLVLNDNVSFPAVDHVPNAVVITFTCGYGDDPSDVPHLTRQGMRLLVAHKYENRGDGDVPIPSGIDHIFRVNWWGKYR